MTIYVVRTKNSDPYWISMPDDESAIAETKRNDDRALSISAISMETHRGIEGAKRIDQIWYWEEDDDE